jgi:hypothetical protein
VYLILPLIIALVALVVAAVIVWRKVSFLRKLTPESHEVGDTVLHDFAPELVDWVRGIPWRQFVRDVLVEIEKFLRRTRLMMSALDRASDKLVRKVRTVHQETSRAHEEVVAQREAQKREEDEEPDEIDMEDPEQLRQEEQRLIVAIAQNPKDWHLYSDLARVYMRLENFTDAAESLQAAVKLEPGNERLQRRLETARKRRDRGAAAAV